LADAHANMDILLAGAQIATVFVEGGPADVGAVPSDPELNPDLESTVGGAASSAQERSGRLRVLLADDHAIVRQSLISLLSAYNTIEIVGEAGNGREAVSLAHTLRPDVVIMDVSMPVMNGAEATLQIKEHLPGTRVIALSMHNEAEIIKKMQESRAESFVLKTASSEELLAAIQGRHLNAVASCSL
jgi:CheY-like chemotaxis protein